MRARLHGECLAAWTIGGPVARLDKAQQCETLRRVAMPRDTRLRKALRRHEQCNHRTDHLSMKRPSEGLRRARGGTEQRSAARRQAGHYGALHGEAARCEAGAAQHYRYAFGSARGYEGALRCVPACMANALRWGHRRAWRHTARYGESSFGSYGVSQASSG